MDFIVLNDFLKLLRLLWFFLNCNILSNFFFHQREIYKLMFIFVPAKFLQLVVSDSAIPLPVAHRFLLSLGFSERGCWSGLLYLPPGNLPAQGMGPSFPVAAALQADSTTEPPGKPQGLSSLCLNSNKI